MANLRETVAKEVKEAATDNEEQETLDQIEVDFGSIPFVKFYPTTLVSGTFPTDDGNPIIRFPDAGNNDGRRDQGYLGLVLEDLTIDTSDGTGFDMSDAAFVETDEDDSTEYRAVNFDDPQTSEKFGGDAVNISGDQYGIEEKTTSIDGRAILVVDRTAAVSVARKLDVNGATLAGMDEDTGQVNGGLIEYAPNDTDTGGVNRRYARNPELRDEFYGDEIGILVTRRSEVDGDYAERVDDPEDETRDMMWYTVVDGDGETVEAVEGEPVGYSFLEWRFDPTAGNLPDSDWEFVQEYVSAGLPTDEDTIISNIEDNRTELSGDPNTERMVGLIQSGVGQ